MIGYGGTDFDHLQTDGIKLRTCILCAFEIKLSKRMHKNMAIEWRNS